MVGCYAMLALLATAPHPHDLRAALPDLPAGAALRDAPQAPLPIGYGDTDRPGCCSLCSWSRISARPPAAAVTHEADTAPLAVRVSASTEPAGAPDNRQVLLRAPPAA